AAVIRSIAGVEGEHMRASYHLQTSYRTSPQMVHPSLGAVVAYEKPPRTELPSFISISGRAMSSGYLGQRCEAYYVGAPGMPDPYLTLPAGLTEGRYQKRLELLAQYNRKHASLRS